MSEARIRTLDGDLNVRPDLRMRALAHRSKSPRNHDAYVRRESAAASALPAAPRRAAARTAISSQSGDPQAEAPVAFAEPPAETDAWWLSRSQAATFTRCRIALSDECARALRATGDAGRIVVEFNGASFQGAALAASAGQYQLDLGDALAQEMASTLDEDDGLAIELIPGRVQPTLAIHPYMSDSL